jgi:hypothetical protein
MDLQHGVYISVHGIRIVHSLVFGEVLCRSLSFLPISLCHCIVYTSSTYNTNDLFGTIKLFVEYLSRIDLRDEMWIISTRMVIRGKILNKSDRMNLYCIGRNLCNNLHVKEDIFEWYYSALQLACHWTSVYWYAISLDYYKGCDTFLTLGPNNSLREGTDQPGQRLLITIEKVVAIWVGMK